MARHPDTRAGRGTEVNEMILTDPNCAAPSLLRRDPSRIGDERGGAPSNSRGGNSLGRYQIVDEIGVGGMATVHLACARGVAGFEKWVAIKRIHPHLADDEQFIGMFLDEARIAARISHPNVAHVFDLGKDEDNYWIAMEYLHGEMLLDVMRATDSSGARMSTTMAAKIAADAAEGLHAAHELRARDGQLLNLVHRDVTPHNLFVTYDGRVKIVDFGVAKASGNLTTTVAGTLKGKLAYMSPEQVQGKRLDRRADIFALGVVLWELTTGRRLFRVESDAETLERVLACVVPPPSTLIDSYPMDLESVVMRALAKDREKRFPTARDMSHAIQQCLARADACIGPEELGGYIRRVLAGRHRQREAHLRWATRVIETTSLGARPAISDEAGDRASTRVFQRLGSERAVAPPPSALPRSPRSPPLAMGRRPSPGRARGSSVLHDYSCEDEDTVTLLMDRSEPAKIQSAPPIPAADAASEARMAVAADVQVPESARLRTPPPTSFPIPTPPVPPERHTRSSALVGAIAAATTLLALGLLALAVIEFGHSRGNRRFANARQTPTASAVAVALDAGQWEAAPVATGATVPGGATIDPGSAPKTKPKASTPVAGPPPRRSAVARQLPPDRGAERGFLTVMCVPACDAVSAGGRSLGPSPVVRTALSPGEHTVALRQGSTTKSLRVLISSGKSAALRVKMEGTE